MTTSDRGALAALSGIFATVIGVIVTYLTSATVTLWLAIAMPVLIPLLALILFGLFQLVLAACSVLVRGLSQLTEMAASIRSVYINRNSFKIGS